MRMVGFHPEAVGLFHGTIRKQLSMDYGRADYEGCLGGLFTRGAPGSYLRWGGSFSINDERVLFPYGIF